MRFNAGYWDGRNAQKRPRTQWLDGVRYGLEGGHFDAIYAQGVRAGYADDSGTDTSDAAWKGRRTLQAERQPSWMSN